MDPYRNPVATAIVLLVWFVFVMYLAFSKD
jgi:hypothetical protein